MSNLKNVYQHFVKSQIILNKLLRFVLKISMIIIMLSKHVCEMHVFTTDFFLL